MGKLQKRLSLYLATFLIIAFVSLAAFFMWFAMQMFENEYIDYLSINRNVVSFILEESTLKKSDREFALEEMGKMFDASIFVCDNKGESIFMEGSINKTTLEINNINEYMKKTLQGEVYGGYNLRQILQEKKMYYGFQVHGDDGEAAVLMVYNVQPFVHQISNFFGFMVMTLVIFLVIFVCIGYFFAGQILKFITRASLSARKIADGDYSQRIDIKTNDELQDFAESFNKLVVAIDERVETITEQKKEIQEYARKQKEFTANAAHELKTPLTSILASAELLKNMEGEIKNVELLEMIVRNSTRLKDIINMLLDLARAESGVVNESFAIEKIDLLAMLQRIGENTKQNYSEKNLKILYECECGELQFEIAKVLFVQIFTNLFDNAGKYTQDEGVIKVKVAVRESMLEVSLSNPGNIDSANLPYLFERFYRTNDARAGGYGGVGLGLAITKHMVIALGGKIIAESVAGETTFRVILPINKE